MAQRDAVIRTREQAAVLFPDVYSGGGPLEIPVITSVHIWQNGKPVVVWRRLAIPTG